LEPVTTFVKWYPDKDTFPTRKGVEGFHLLIDLPGPKKGLSSSDIYMFNFLKPVPFNPGSSLAFQKTLHEVYSTWPIGNEVRLEWEKWSNETCPKSDDAEEYIQSHGMSVPLESFFFSDALMEVCSWDLQNKQLTFETADFSIPTELSMCLPSVTCRFNKNPPPSRVYATTDGELKVNRDNFNERTQAYYADYVNSIPMKGPRSLTTMLRQRVDFNGAVGSVSGTKARLVNKLHQGDLSFLNRYFKTIISCNMYLIHRQLTRHIPTLSELDSEVLGFDFCFIRIKSFSPVESCIRPELVDCMMKRYLAIDDQYFTAIRDVNSTDLNYKPYWRSYYGSSNMLRELKNQLYDGLIEERELIACRRLFMPFKISEIFENDQDDWCLLVMDVATKISYYVNGKYGRNVAISNECRTQFIKWNNS
jgi:hypothetical protein